MPQKHAGKTNGKREGEREGKGRRELATGSEFLWGILLPTWQAVLRVRAEEEPAHLL